MKRRRKSVREEWKVSPNMSEEAAVTEAFSVGIGRAHAWSYSSVSPLPNLLLLWHDGG